MLAEIYNWFTEGFDPADLKDAKALLEELNALPFPRRGPIRVKGSLRQDGGRRSQSLPVRLLRGVAVDAERTSIHRT
jgi:hypothetical protein